MFGPLDRLNPFHVDERERAYRAQQEPLIVAAFHRGDYGYIKPETLSNLPVWIRDILVREQKKVSSD